MDLHYCREVLNRAGVVFDAGLTPSELAAAEERHGFRFPPDLRAFLAFALPTGQGFPDWRDLDSSSIAASMAWPLEGMCFDIEHNAFWPPEWGERPLDFQAAFAVARRHVAAAPRLIPIFGHRYLPDRPCAAGNPVFSVHQTDIICYGSNLETYLQNEFSGHFETPHYSLGSSLTEIDLWSWLVRLNE